VVTIADVAAHAGVGAGTVSRVLNDSPVSASAPAPGSSLPSSCSTYRPNPLARGLSRGRSQTLGVVVPFFTHASAVERLRGVVSSLDGSRYDLVLFNVESRCTGTSTSPPHPAGPRRRPAHHVAPPPPGSLRRLADAGVPVVCSTATARGAGGHHRRRRGWPAGHRHLIDLGHEHIAFIGDEPDNPLGFTSSGAGSAATRRPWRTPGSGRAGRRRHGPHVRTVARRMAEELLAGRDRPTAVFAASDSQALGVLEAARAHGLDVPRDLSVVGFDDVEVSSYAGSPRSVSRCSRAVGGPRSCCWSRWQQPSH
jgi:DNA-binding LacI/PurR family transcriptional regulator